MIPNINKGRVENMDTLDIFSVIHRDIGIKAGIFLFREFNASDLETNSRQIISQAYFLLKNIGKY